MEYVSKFIGKPSESNSICDEKLFFISKVVYWANSLPRKIF